MKLFDHDSCGYGLYEGHGEKQRDSKTVSTFNKTYVTNDFTIK
jgi:hypothetical protein